MKTDNWILLILAIVIVWLSFGVFLLEVLGVRHYIVLCSVFSIFPIWLYKQKDKRENKDE